MPLPSDREPLVDGGRITRVWLRALQDSLTAAESASTAADLAALQTSLLAAIAVVQTEVDALEASALSEQDLEDLRIEMMARIRPAPTPPPIDDAQAVLCYRVFA